MSFLFRSNEKLRKDLSSIDLYQTHNNHQTHNNYAWAEVVLHNMTGQKVQ